MKKPKFCPGCFLEWEGESSVCLHCGWDNEKKEVVLKKWNVGDILEKRYLVGKRCFMAEDVTIWRMYDNILRCPVCVLYGKEKSKEELLDIAVRMKEAVLLSIKQIDKRDVLVFSLQNRFMKEEVFQACLCEEKVVNAVGGQENMQSGKKEKNHTVADQNAEAAREKTLPEGIFLDNRYQVIRCLGIGGFGITYLCEDLYLHRYVAIKEYFPEQWAEREDTFVAVKKSSMINAFQYGMKSFCKEIQITAKFMHTSHIVTVFDAFEDNDTVYMVMEYINGMSIGKELRNREYRPYTVSEMAEIILPLLDALEAIHEKSIVHSDISPGNIIRSKDGEIVLIDMGAAKYALDSQPALSAAFLKIDYAAPEQYQTAKEGIPKGEGPWTDIYAVGATMYYLLTGHRPTDVIRRLSSKKTDLISPKKYKVNVSRQWMKLIHQAVAVEKNERISSVPILREKMKDLLE